MIVDMVTVICSMQISNIFAVTIVIANMYAHLVFVMLLRTISSTNGTSLRHIDS